MYPPAYRPHHPPRARAHTFERTNLKTHLKPTPSHPGTSMCPPASPPHPPSRTDKYDKEVVEEEGIPLERRVVAKAGKMDAKKRLEEGVGQLMSTNIVQCMGAMLDTIVF